MVKVNDTWIWKMVAEEKNEKSASKKIDPFTK